MKQIYLKLLFFFISFLSCCHLAPAQSTSGIQARCSGTLLYSQIQINRSGDIVHTPCIGRASIFNGNVDFSGATITGVVTGTGTANYVPRFTSSSVIGNTPLSWNGTVFNFTDTGLTSEFALNFTPNNSAGSFNVGDCTTTISNCIALAQSTGTLNIRSDSTQTFTTQTGESAVVFNPVNSQFEFTNFGGGGTVTFNLDNTLNRVLFDVAEFRINNRFAVSVGSDCTGELILGGGGTVVKTLSTCTADSSSIILLTYKAASGRVVPLSYEITDTNEFTVYGDAGERAVYFIVNTF